MLEFPTGHKHATTSQIWICGHLLELVNLSPPL